VPAPPGAGRRRIGTARLGRFIGLIVILLVAAFIFYGPGRF
jgi:hypothetical protein